MQRRCLVLLVASSLLAACATEPRTPPPTPENSKISRTPSRKSLPAVNPLPDPSSSSKPGGYYLDDGPPEVAVDIASLPEPMPRDEPEHPRANGPYTVHGEVVVPERGRKAYQAEGVASWYGKRFHGRKTSSGEKYDMYAFSAAHRTLPIPSYVRVTHIKNGKSVIVRVNDRGPFHKKRLIDLSYAAAAKLGYINSGHAQVKIERIFPGDTPALTDDARAAQEDRDRPSNDAASSADETTDLDASKTYWQLGAFRLESSAATFAGSIRKHLSKKQSVTVVSAPPLFRVLAGPYPDESSARADLDRLTDALGSTPVLLRPTTIASLP